MQLELTREFVENLQILIEEKKTDEVKSILDGLHPADIAEVMGELNTDEARYIYVLLSGERASDVLVDIPDDERTRFLKGLPSDVIARHFIEFMDSDDAADVLGELSEEKKEEVLHFISDVEQAGDIVDLLSYDEDTAGGLMQKELVQVNANWTVQTCLKEISRQAEDIDEIYYVYVIDNDEILQGILSLKKLILTPTHEKISKLFNIDVISVKTETDSEEVANLMAKYDLVAVPVVDSIGRLKGRITIDDVVHVIREEAERDFQLATGISEDIEPTDSVWVQSRARLPWLLIGLFGGIFGARVIGTYETSLADNPTLTFFFPLIMAMGGNVGVQSSSIVVQSLANNTLLTKGVSMKILKELRVAILNATVCSSLIFAYNQFIDNSNALTLTVSISLFSVIIFASIFGTFVPLTLSRLKIDPALATGPFITTTNDILGLVIYLVIGKMMFAIL
jgi:magnesium transporter